MASQTAIITGGAGFLGRYTIGGLIERGFSVHVLARTITAEYSASIRKLYGGAVQLHQVDLHDTDTVTPLIKKIKASYFLHLAWDTRHEVFWNSPDNLDWIVTSKLLLQAFIEAGGSRFVGVGTCAEYDWEGSTLVLTEGVSKLLPTTIYGQSKLAFRKSLATLADHYGIQAAWGRVFLFNGPYENPKRLIPSVIISLLQGNEFLASAGDHIRDFSDVRDVAAGFVALLDSDVTGDVNIASGEARSVSSVLMRIGELLNKKELVKIGTQPTGAVQRIVASVERLRRDVKYKPALPFEEKLVDTIQWWKNQGIKGVFR